MPVVQPHSFSLLNSQVLLPIYNELYRIIYIQWELFNPQFSLPPVSQSNTAWQDCEHTTCGYLIFLFHSNENLLLLEENQVWQGSNVISLVRKIQQILGNFSPGWVHFVILQIILIKLLWVDTNPDYSPTEIKTIKLRSVWLSLCIQYIQHSFL